MVRYWSKTDATSIMPENILNSLDVGIKNLTARINDIINRNLGSVSIQNIIRSNAASTLQIAESQYNNAKGLIDYNALFSPAKSANAYLVAAYNIVNTCEQTINNIANNPDNYVPPLSSCIKHPYSCLYNNSYSPSAITANYKCPQTGGNYIKCPIERYINSKLIY